MDIPEYYILDALEHHMTLELPEVTANAQTCCYEEFCKVCDYIQGESRDYIC